MSSIKSKQDIAMSYREKMLDKSTKELKEMAEASNLPKYGNKTKLADRLTKYKYKIDVSKLSETPSSPQAIVKKKKTKSLPATYAALRSSPGSPCADGRCSSSESKIRVREPKRVDENHMYKCLRRKCKHDDVSMKRVRKGMLVVIDVMKKNFDYFGAGNDKLMPDLLNQLGFFNGAMPKQKNRIRSCVITTLADGPSSDLSKKGKDEHKKSRDRDKKEKRESKGKKSHKGK